MSEVEKPNYYGIIPANVRYDKDLKPNAKLLYSEFTCLATKEGYCYSSNNYFAELYGVDPSTISKWVKQLAEKKYIRLEYIYVGNECKERRIYINNSVENDESKSIGIASTSIGIAENNDRVLPPEQEGYCQKIKGNNTRVNNTSINNINLYTKQKKQKIFNPPTLEEIQSYIQEKNYNVDAKVFFDYYEATEWHDVQGKPVKNWKGKIITWASRNNDTKGSVKNSLDAKKEYWF